MFNYIHLLQANILREKIKNLRQIYIIIFFYQKGFSLVLFYSHLSVWCYSFYLNEVL